MAAPTRQQIALRGSEGLWMIHGPPDISENINFKGDTSSGCRVMAYSCDGSLFAWCNSKSTIVVRLADQQTVRELDLPKTAQLCLSPLGTYLATWQLYQAVKENPLASHNLRIWKLATGELVKSTIQRKRENWRPQWTHDESICAVFASGGVHFFKDHDFDNIAARLQLPRMDGCVLAQGSMPPMVAAYVPVVKGTPAFVRLYKYPRLGGEGSALANKSFFKADSVHMLWNKKGTAVLALANTDSDKSGQSYYGEQTLHFLDTSGQACGVQLAKKGPIYSVDWNPNSTDFCVVYGFVPAKTTLFDLKCEPIYDFGTGPRNSVYYNPHGTIICLAGFGNLRGHMEFWGRSSLKLLSKMQAEDSTMFEWSPDGEHCLTATCSPRLRVGNGYKIWNYLGHLLSEYSVPLEEQLWDAVWQPFPEGSFPAKAVMVPKTTPADAKPAPYRPPHATAFGASFKLTENEPAEATTDKALSKNALKNKKKRDAKAKAKQQELVGTPLDSRSSEQRDALALASYILSPAQPATIAVPTEASTAVEREKRIKNLTKKLRAIEKLKEQQASGKTLESNQLQKIQGERDIVKELKDLELGN